MKSDEIGSARVWVKEDPDCFALHPDCYDGLLRDWLAGAAFYTGPDLYGDETTIKLGQVVAVTRATPGAMAARRADAEADHQREALS